jgi:hypothetical protein
MKPKDEGISLICMRASKAAEVPLGASFDHLCSSCFQRVVVAPSGQRFLRTYPKTATICDACYWDEPRRWGTPSGTAAPVDEILAEMATKIPNPLRRSN